MRNVEEMIYGPAIYYAKIFDSGGAEGSLCADHRLTPFTRPAGNCLTVSR